MYKHLLVPTDGSALSMKAVKSATALAKSLKAKITALYVMPHYEPPGENSTLSAGHDYSPAGHHKRAQKEADKALAKVESVAAHAKVRCAVLSVMGVEPWEAIIASAKSKKCDVIVMSSHGRGGLAGLLLGSETQKVLSHSTTPVLVCR